MKEVLISIQPKWCQLISSGEKTVEVRKTKPKQETPFKCYIYETKGLYEGAGGYLFNGRGKVIGEFVCDEIVAAECGFYCSLNPTETLLDAFDLLDYADGKTVYGWHISDLVIYDKPKELSEFSRHDSSYDNAFGWAFEDRAKTVSITRPPQSWCYVESAEGDKE